MSITELFVLLIGNIPVLLIVIISIFIFLIAVFGGIAFLIAKIRNATFTTPIGTFEMGKDHHIDSIIKNYYLLAEKKDIFYSTIRELHQTTMRSQMKLVEATILKIYNQVKHTFEEKLIGLLDNGQSYLDHMDYREFSLCLDKMATISKDNLREKILKNGFDKMDEYSFQKYSDRSFEDIYSGIKDILDRYYRGVLISRQLFSKLMLEIKPSQEEEIKSLLKEIRKITLSQYEKIDLMYKEYDEFFNDLIKNKEGLK